MNGKLEATRGKSKRWMDGIIIVCEFLLMAHLDILGQNDAGQFVVGRGPIWEMDVCESIEAFVLAPVFPVFVDDQDVCETFLRGLFHDLLDRELFPMIEITVGEDEQEFTDELVHVLAGAIAGRDDDLRFHFTIEIVGEFVHLLIGHDFFISWIHDGFIRFPCVFQSSGGFFRRCLEGWEDREEEWDARVRSECCWVGC